MRRMYSKNELTQAIQETKKDISTLVDAHGNPRFVEADIETETITGVTFSYAKWSLSGTHLMIVLAGTLNAGQAVSANTKLCDIELPKYIRDKLIPIYSTFLSSKIAEDLEETSYSSITIQGVCDKITNGVTIATGSGISAPTYKNHFRLEFDFLVDSAE